MLVASLHCTPALKTTQGALSITGTQNPGHGYGDSAYVHRTHGSTMRTLLVGTQNDYGDSAWMLRHTEPMARLYGTLPGRRVHDHAQIDTFFPLVMSFM